MHIKYALDGYREHFKKNPLQELPTMTEDQIKHMVSRFLAWKLPEHFNPDNGISFDRSVPHPACPPVGTNLFSADQAEAMVRHLVEGMPAVDVAPIIEAARAEADKFFAPECRFEKASFVDGAGFALRHLSP